MASTDAAGATGTVSVTTEPECTWVPTSQATGHRARSPGHRPLAAAGLPTEGVDSLALFECEEPGPSDGLLTPPSALDLFPSESADRAADVSESVAHAYGSWTSVPRVDIAQDTMLRLAPGAVLDPPDGAAVGRHGPRAAGIHPGTTVARYAGGQRKRTQVTVVLTTAMLLGLPGVLNVRVGSRSSMSAPALPTPRSAQGAKPAWLAPDAERTRTAAVPSTATPESAPPMTATAGPRALPSPVNAAIDPPSAVLPMPPSVEPPRFAAAAMLPPVLRSGAAATESASTAVETILPEHASTPRLFSSPIGPFASSLPRSASGPVDLADTQAVQAVLDRYQHAWNDLDASAAKAIWPAVDEKALGRAFGQLERQQVMLDACDVAVSGVLAEATCGGRASYVPKIGHQTVRVEPRRWAFTLRHTGHGWIIATIESAVAR